jgi:hypothetical protein
MADTGRAELEGICRRLRAGRSSAPIGGKDVSDMNGIATSKNSSPFARCIVVIRTPGADRSSAAAACRITAETESPPAETCVVTGCARCCAWPSLRRHR